MAKPSIRDVSTLIQAGINPKNGLPIKVDNNDPCELKNNIKKQLRIVDEQNAVRRYKWYNLPDGLDGELVERILYYKGQGMFFYMETDNKFYFLPYALDGNIDVYGRYTGVTPLPFNGSTSPDGKDKPWIIGLNRKPVYSIKLDGLKISDLTDSCVLLHDYVKQISQTTIARQILNEPLLDVMAECVPYMRTSLLLGTGIEALRVNDADQAASVEEANRSVHNAALTGKGYIAVTAPMEFQELNNGAIAKSEEYMMAMQSLDNFRLGLYGLDNGGLFEKKGTVLQDEFGINAGNVGLVYQDGLSIRQKFCDIVNSIWGLAIWCEPSEAVLGMDQNMDGAAYDEENDSYGSQTSSSMEANDDTNDA